MRSENARCWTACGPSYDGVIRRCRSGYWRGGNTVKPTIVLADGDDAVARMYSTALEHHGFEVTVAPSVAALSALIADAPPDVLVLDWELPGIGEPDLVSVLSGHDIRVIVLTNAITTEEEVIDHVFEAGALAWFVKVHTPPDLLVEKLNQVLGTPKAIHEARPAHRRTVRQAESVDRSGDEQRAVRQHEPLLPVTWERFIELRIRWQQLRARFESWGRPDLTDKTRLSK